MLLLTILMLLTLQEPPEFGDFSELKGRHTVYILTEDLEARKVIVNEINSYVRKGKVKLTVAERGEDAEIWILYGGGSTRTTYKDVHQSGELAVSIRGSEIAGSSEALGGIKHRHRIVYSTRSSRSFSSGITFQRAPEKKAVRKFLEQLSKLQKS